MNELLTVEQGIDALLVGSGHNLTTPEKVEELETKMLDLPQAECPVKHIFGAGIYIREVSIPAGVFSVGHHQKTEHMNHMIKGKVAMLNDDGAVEIVEAPASFVSKPGRKIGLILEDMVWRNIYPTDETDIETLESTYLDKSEGWQADSVVKKQIESIMKQPERDDFCKMLDERGVSCELAREQSENESDQMPMPQGIYKMVIADSCIEGKGAFATSDINSGEIIAPAAIGGLRTPAGRYVNHSPSPNAEMALLDSGDIDLVATRDISGCYGGENGEEITVDYRQAVAVAIRRSALCHP